MMHDINSTFSYIVDMLFDPIPFTYRTKEAREAVSNALQNRYDAMTQEHSALQAFAETVSAGTTLEDAGKLAGYDDQTIAAWKDTAGALSKQTYQKQFLRLRIWLYLGLIAYISCLSFLFPLYLRQYRTLPFLLIDLLIGTVCMMRYKRAASHMFSATFTFQADVRGMMVLSYDRYGKRLLHSMLLLVWFIFLILFSAVNFQNASSGNHAEIINFLISYETILSTLLFFVLKSLYLRRCLDRCLSDERKRPYNRTLLQIFPAAVIYCMLTTIGCLLFAQTTSYAQFFFWTFSFLYAFGILCFDFFARKKIVFCNFKKNIPRTILVGTIITTILGVYLLRMDSWLVQPYISSIPSVTPDPCSITYEEETGVYTIVSDKDDFKILQLTDIHLGGSSISVTKDIKAYKTIYDLILYTKPDFIIVTGDLVFPLGIMSFSVNNRTPFLQFASFMRNIGIPWAFTYGNHDTESIARASEDTLDEILKSLSYKNSGTFLYPYIQPQITGRSNQRIDLRLPDGTLRQSLFLLDSNTYQDGIHAYDYIHDDQVEWYVKNIEDLCESEGYTIPSMLFFHIPLTEYRDAYEAYQKNDPNVIYHYGEIGETYISPICCPDIKSKLFDTAHLLGSTKAMFCGHDHYNNLSVTYQGIRLTYGFSIDYLAMPGIEYDTAQRGATCISITKDGSFTITPIRYQDIS